MLRERTADENLIARESAGGSVGQTIGRQFCLPSAHPVLEIGVEHDFLSLSKIKALKFSAFHIRKESIEQVAVALGGEVPAGGLG
ncbi:unknown [Sutterella wadsworthensis CAG:135]|nr:unknown [Sutterella wadsworthensis CAG:135]